MSVEAHNMTVRIGDAELLSDVSFHAAPGTVTGLIGPNGAGKSTLLASLSGDIPVASGVLQIDGVEPRHAKPKAMARKRAVMLQDVSVTFSFLVRDVVAMGRSPWEGTSSPEEDNAIIDAALEATGVSHLAGREVVTLSPAASAPAWPCRVSSRRPPRWCSSMSQQRPWMLSTKSVPLDSSGRRRVAGAPSWWCCTISTQRPIIATK